MSRNPEAICSLTYIGVCVWSYLTNTKTGAIMLVGSNQLCGAKTEGVKTWFMVRIRVDVRHSVGIVKVRLRY